MWGEFQSNPGYGKSEFKQAHPFQMSVGLVGCLYVPEVRIEGSLFCLA